MQTINGIFPIEKLARSLVPIEEEVQAYSDGMTSLTQDETINADQPPIIPVEILIGSLRDGSLRVVAPLRVKVSREDTGFVLEAVDLNEFGFGDNLSEAIVDIQYTIAELYYSLQAEPQCLGPDLQKVWKELRQAIRQVVP